MLFYIITLAVIIADQASKYFVSKLMYLGQTFPVIRHIFSITFIRNTGAAFGIFRGQQSLLAMFSLAFIVAILIYIWQKRKRDLLVDISLAFILGGSAGNLIDRVFRGYVVDFFDVKYFSVFNVADAMMNPRRP